MSKHNKRAAKDDSKQGRRIPEKYTQTTQVAYATPAGGDVPLAGIDRYTAYSENYLSERVLAPRHSQDPESNMIGEQENLNTILCTHFMNAPFVNDDLVVDKLQWPLFKYVHDYDGVNSRCFFMDNADLAILKQSEPRTEEFLRVHEFELVHRLTERVVRYYNTSVAFLASTTNLASLQRFNGNAQFKDVATNFRRAILNNITNIVQKFPFPVSAYDYIMANTKDAACLTTYGAPMLSIGLWDVQVHGNRAHRTIMPQQFLDQTGHIPIDLKATTASPQANRLKALMTHINEVLVAYGGVPNADDEFPAGSLVHDLSSPVPLNAASVGIDQLEAGETDKLEGALLTYLGSSSIQHIKAMNQARHTAGMADIRDFDHVTMLIRHQFDVLSKMMVEQFSDFANPGSIWYQFLMGTSNTTSAIKEGFNINNVVKFKLCQFGEITKIVSANKQWDAGDLLNKMGESSRMRVPTATLVKWCPLMPTYTGNESSNMHYEYDVYKDSDGKINDLYVERNFERQGINLNNQAMNYLKGEEWPRLSPTAFHVPLTDLEIADQVASKITGSQYATYVANTIPDYQDMEFGANSDRTDQGLPINKQVNDTMLLGGTEYLLALSRAAQLDPMLGSVEIAGLDPDEAKAFINTDRIGVCTKEYPSQILAPVMPLFDSSDPHQLGFNLWMRDDSIFKPEWQLTIERGASDPQFNPAKDDESDLRTECNTWSLRVDTSVAVRGYDMVPAQGIIEEETIHEKVQHWASKWARSQMKSAMMFTGASLLTKPLYNAASPDSGYYPASVIWRQYRTWASADTRIKRLALQYNHAAVVTSHFEDMYSEYLKLTSVQTDYGPGSATEGLLDHRNIMMAYPFSPLYPPVTLPHPTAPLEAVLQVAKGLTSFNRYSGNVISAYGQPRKEYAFIPALVMSEGVIKLDPTFWHVEYDFDAQQMARFALKWFIWKVGLQRCTSDEWGFMHAIDTDTPFTIIFNPDKNSGIFSTLARTVFNYGGQPAVQLSQLVDDFQVGKIPNMWSADSVEEITDYFNPQEILFRPMVPGRIEGSGVGHGINATKRYRKPTTFKSRFTARIESVNPEYINYIEKENKSMSSRMNNWKNSESGRSSEASKQIDRTISPATKKDRKDVEDAKTKTKDESAADVTQM